MCVLHVHVYVHTVHAVPVCTYVHMCSHLYVVHVVCTCTYTTTHICTYHTHNYSHLHNIVHVPIYTYLHRPSFFSISTEMTPSLCPSNCHFRSKLSFSLSLYTNTHTVQLIYVCMYSATCIISTLVSTYSWLVSTLHSVPSRYSKLKGTVRTRKTNTLETNYLLLQIINYSSPITTNTNQFLRITNFGLL